jgi:hypothetical protein
MMNEELAERNVLSAGPASIKVRGFGVYQEEHAGGPGCLVPNSASRMQFP